MRNFLAISLILTSCQSKKEIINDFPVKPALNQYESGPVYKKIGDNYEVSPDLVENTVLLTDYYKRIDSWKTKRGIR